MTSANTTKFNTLGVDGGQTELFNYFVDGVDYSRPFPKTMCKYSLILLVSLLSYV